MRHRHVLPAALLLVGAALAGCSNDSSTDASAGSSTGAASTSSSPSASASASDPGTESSTPSPSASESSSPSAQPTAKNYLPEDRIAASALHVSVLASSSAGTAEERAAVKTWMAYWNAASDSYYYARVVPALDATSRGTARSSVVGYLGRLKANKQRVVGWAQDHVSKVSVTGDTATIRDCTKNFTFSLDSSGDPASRPDPWYDVRGTLVREHGGWIVTRATSTTLTTSCL